MAGSVVGFIFSAILFSVLHISVFGIERVPVLIWDTEDGVSRELTSPSPLSKLSSDEFSDYFQRKVASRTSKSGPVIALFLEENLCVEDFSWEDVEEHSSFPHLENLTSQAARVDFLPSVHTPLKGLKSLGYPWHVYRSVDDLDSYVDTERGLVLVVKLGDAKVEENRPEFLSRHDLTMCTIYKKLQSKYDNLIAIYTSRHSSRSGPEEEPTVRQVRSLLAATEGSDSENTTTFWHDKDNKIYLYSPNYPRINTMGSDPSQDYLITSCKESTRDERADYQRLIMLCSGTPSRKITLRLRFPVSTSNYWNLKEIEYEENGTMALLKTSSDVYAPLRFSYHCSSEILFIGVNESITLKFSNVQIQPNVENMKFGDAYDCVWFFTMPIWSGLFVTVILALIMIWGLTMIMDIKTMDRFDDPKGKTITISATD